MWRKYWVPRTLYSCTENDKIKHNFSVMREGNHWNRLLNKIVDLPYLENKTGGYHFSRYALGKYMLCLTQTPVTGLSTGIIG